MRHFLLAVSVVGALIVRAANVTVNSGETLFITDSYGVTESGNSLVLKDGATIAVASGEGSAAGLREYSAVAVNAYAFSDGFSCTASLGTFLSARTNLFHAVGTFPSETPFRYYTSVGRWYVPEDGIYSFYANVKVGVQFFIDNQLIFFRTSPGAYCQRNVSLSAGWHSVMVLVSNNYSSKSDLGQNSSADFAGIQYSPTNANITAGSNLGIAFDDTGDGTRLRDRFNSVLIHPLISDGGMGTLNLENLDVVTPFLLAGGFISRNGGTLSVTGIPAGGSLCVGKSYSPSFCSGTDSGMIDAANIMLPEGVKLSLCGTSIITSKPSVPFEIHENAEIFPFVPDFFGNGENDLYATNFHLTLPSADIVNSNATIHVGAGRRFRPFPCKVGDPLQGTLTTFWNDTKNSFYNNIVLEGTGANIYVRPLSGGTPILYGDISGVGSIDLFGWSSRMTLAGKLSFYGSISLGQRATILIIRDTCAGSPSNTVRISSDYGGTYAASRVEFQCPGYDEKETFAQIGVLNAEGSVPGPYAGAGQKIFAKQTVSIGELKGRGVSLLDSPNGIGTLVVGKISSTMSVYIPTNVSMTVTNVATASTFAYYASNGVNRTTFRVEGTCHEGAAMTALSPRMLPRHVSGFTGMIQLDPSVTSWDFPFDFTQEDPDLNGCEGSGVLSQVAAAGQMSVSVTGRPVPGRYALMTCDSGAGKLAGWTVNAPEAVRGFRFTIVRDDTGVWLEVRPGGALVIFR